jgi:cytochrome c oxidase assembly protein subunit 15
MTNSQSRSAVGYWLMLGVFMIFIQVLLGGITRLTGSGLSITQWDVLMGSLPPLNQQQWQHAFEQYKEFPQYKLMNSDMTLSGFKSIFFWEFIHRLWARLLGVAFIIPFIYFLVKKMIGWQLGKKLIVIFILGGLQGLMGWVMVQSGLIDKPWVSPVDLSAHLILALILYCYLFWVALEVLLPGQQLSIHDTSKKYSWMFLCLLFFQIFYGGLMAGNKAALFYPTFPKIGSSYIPGGMLKLSPVALNFVENIATIQLIHRTLGLLVALYIFWFYWKNRKNKWSPQLSIAMVALPVLVTVQVLLGILTLINSLGKIPVTYGVLHQMTALLLLTDAVFITYYFSRVQQTLKDPEKILKGSSLPFPQKASSHL